MLRILWTYQITNKTVLDRRYETQLWKGSWHILDAQNKMSNTSLYLTYHIKPVER